MPDNKPGKKSKRKDNRPARQRYWRRRRLEENKVKHLMAQGYTKPQALGHWRKVRQGRVPDGWLGGAVA